MSYVYQPYPKMLYRGTAQCVVGNYSEQQDREANGWGNAPGFTAEPACEVNPAPIEPKPVEAQPIEPTPIEPKPVKAPRLRVNGKFVKKVPDDGA
jgi:hypothetical protein